MRYCSALEVSPSSLLISPCWTASVIPARLAEKFCVIATIVPSYSCKTCCGPGEAGAAGTGPGSGTSESGVRAGLVGALSAPDLVCAGLRTGMTVIRMTMRINVAFMFLLLGLTCCSTSTLKDDACYDSRTREVEEREGSSEETEIR